MTNKKRDISSLLVSILVLILLNYVASFVFHRFDLTSEKRYTLSDATKKLLGTLNDVVYVKVYMGKNEDFPAGFKHLRSETEEILNEFRTYADDNVEFEFINLNDYTDEKQKKEVFKQLYQKGLEPTNLEVKTEDGVSQKIVWPAALVTYKGRELPWQLLRTQMGVSPEMQLNNSVQSLEYEFASCIRNLSVAERPQIGFITGHGELDALWVDDIKYALQEFYEVKTLQINNNPNVLKGLKAIVVAKPDTAFSENDKYIIDQYLMHGGKALFAIDALNTSVDSLRQSGFTLAYPYELHLDDMFFKYGFRVNQNLVVDLQSSAIPVNKAFAGQEPRFELAPWIFSPLLMPQSKHPIVKNLEVIKVDFSSTIDTIATPAIRKTILLNTSRYSKVLKSPVQVDMRIVNLRPDERMLNDAYKPVALLLEGRFESVYKNRTRPALPLVAPFKDLSTETKLIVVSDGDIIANDVQLSTAKPYPLGYDKYTNRTYGNKNFILNSINYLCDDSGLITVRSRELTLRLLNKKKIHHEKLKWQIVNVVMPLGLILVFGISYAVWRKRKYGR